MYLRVQTTTQYLNVLQNCTEYFEKIIARYLKITKFNGINCSCIMHLPLCFIAQFKNDINICLQRGMFKEAKFKVTVKKTFLYF